MTRDEATAVLRNEGVSTYWDCIAAATRIYELDCLDAGKPFDPIGVLARAGVAEAEAIAVASLLRPAEASAA